MEQNWAEKRKRSVYYFTSTVVRKKHDPFKLPIFGICTAHVFPLYSSWASAMKSGKLDLKNK
jgi:hypothetical protein